MTDDEQTFEWDIDIKRESLHNHERRNINLLICIDCVPLSPDGWIIDASVIEQHQ